MKIFKIWLFLFVVALTGCAKNSYEKEINQSVIVGMTTFGDYVLTLQLCEGAYENDMNPGPTYGEGWTGTYELVISQMEDGEVISRYLLDEWNEPLLFRKTFDLQLKDYNEDGNLEVLIGQYGCNNFNVYRMYYITEELEIGSYLEIGEILISSQEMSPVLKSNGNELVYTYYDNSLTNTIEKKIDFELLTVK